MIRNVKIVTIVVRNQQKSLEFFRDKIGLKVLVDDHRIVDNRWIELVAEGGRPAIALVEAGKGDKIGCFSNVMFGCDNVYSSYHDLRSRGVEFLTAPTEESWGTFAVFTDPDGNSFVIAS